MSRNSISKIALQAMSIRLTIVVMIMTAVGFWYNYGQIEKRTISELEMYVKERVERESIYFERPQNNLGMLAETLKTDLARNDRNYHQEFLKKFSKKSDGTYGPAGKKSSIQMFLKKGVTVTPEMEKRIVVLNDLLFQFGHAWRAHATNVWVAGAEDYGLTYWPSRPEALTNLPSDHSFHLYEYSQIGLPENNPEGEVRWTGPYFDVMSKDWLISVNYPVIYEGKYILSLGMDVLLNDFFTRSISNVLPGTFNIVFMKDGRLVTHPTYMDEIKKSEGKFLIQEKGDPVLKDILSYHYQSRTPILDDNKNDQFVGVGTIKGPDWRFVLVYPKKNLKKAAVESAFVLALFGLFSLIIELLMLHQVLHKYVVSPIQKLILATNKIASGEIEARVKVDSDDEVGQLGHSFNIMGDKVQERDKLLSIQAAKLEVQVQERSAELDVQRAKAFQAAKMATLGEIAGGVAHEINNPLSAITLSAGVIRKKIEKGQGDKENLFPYLTQIEATSSRISKIIKGLRAFSRNAEHDPVTPVLLSNIIDNTMTLCEQTLKNNDVAVECSTIPDKKILCRESEIVQTLLNLIQNAIDALAETKDKKITISFSEQEHFTTIIVEDNGPGIPKEIEDKIMNPFFTTKDVGKGTGLGLFISFGLVKSNGGNLTLEQSPGSTKFLVSLKNE